MRKQGNLKFRQRLGALPNACGFSPEPRSRWRSNTTLRESGLSKYRIKRMSAREMLSKAEPGAAELSSSAAMEPYIRAHVAQIRSPSDRIDRLVEPLAEIAGLPLEKRYIWRIASALKWGFADFDSATVALDRDTMPDEHRQEVAKLLAHRPAQFALMLKALYGEAEMECMMMEAIAFTKERREPAVIES